MTPDNRSDSPGIKLHPLGHVRSELKKPTLRADDKGLTLDDHVRQAREIHRKIKSLVSELVFDEQHEPLLDGVEDFSHILVLYWPHLLDPKRRSLQRVRPMGRTDMPEKGIFSTCSPARPNPVLVTPVRLLERKGPVLRVQGLEAVDGSPILDVKPYILHYHKFEALQVPDWMDQLHKEIE